MNKRQQIEEMARLMCDGCANHGDCKYDICDATLDEAERFYDAGYRKQNEIVKEIFAEIEEIFKAHKISSFDNSFDDAMTDEIDKLKKKYMEVM